MFRPKSKKKKIIRSKTKIHNIYRDKKIYLSLIKIKINEKGMLNNVEVLK